MKKPKLFLVKTIINWADEMDLSGFGVFTQEAIDYHLATAKLFFSVTSDFPVRQGIGSNQDLYHKSFSAYKKQIKVAPISSLDAKKLLKQFNLKINSGSGAEEEYSSFGVFTLFNNVHMEEGVYSDGGAKGEQYLLKFGGKFWEKIIKEDQKLKAQV